MSTTLEVSREDGVKDLPLSVRRWFAKALVAERDGDKAKAEEYLDLAIAEEAKQPKS